jgi:hypothetical protein
MSALPSPLSGRSCVGSHLALINGVFEPHLRSTLSHVQIVALFKLSCQRV